MVSQFINTMKRLNFKIACYKYLLLSFLCLPLSLNAEQTFLEANIKTSGEASLQVFQLPESFYLDSNQESISKLRIIDKFGSELPFNIEKYSGVVSQQKRKLMLYPLTESRYLQSQTETLRLKYDQKDRLTQLEKNNNQQPSNKVVGYLIDLGESYPRGSSVVTFDLSQVAQTSFLKFSIDQSNNLKDWKKLSRREVLAQLVNNGSVAQHNKITLRNSHSRYLRINLEPEHNQQHSAFKLLMAEQSFTREVQTALTWTEYKKLQYDDKDDAYILDISIAIAYKQVQLKMPKAPSIITADIFLKRKSATPWRFYKQVNLVNIQDENVDIVENQFPVWFGSSSKVKFVVKYADPPFNQNSVWVKLAYVPQKVTFYANGNEPYRVQFGQIASNHNNQQLLNMIKAQTNSTMGIARLGLVRAVKMDDESSEINWKAISLWLTLIAGVVVMAWMAKNLLKQMEK